jgi:hypothetical protein
MPRKIFISFLGTGKYEECILPFRYVIENGKVVLPKDFIEFIKKRKSF